MEEKKWLWLVLGLALLLRLWDINAPFEGHHAMREVMHAGEAEFLLNDGEFLNLKNYFGDISSNMYGELPTYLVYFSFRIFGQHEWVARLPILAITMLSLYAFYLMLSELYGTRQALFGTFLLSVSPMHIYFSRMLISDSLLTSFSIISLFFFVRWFKEGSSRDIFASAASFSIAMHVKIIAAYLLVTYGLVLIFGNRERVKSIALWFSFAAAIALPFLWKWAAYGSLKLPPHVAGVDYSLLLSLQYYLNVAVMIGWGLTPLLLLLFLFGFIASVRDAGRHRIVLSWLFSGILALLYTAQYSFLGDYYFLMLVPPLCAVASNFAGALGKRGFFVVSVAVFLSALPFTYMIYSVDYPYKAAGEFIKNNTVGGDFIISEPSVAYYAKRGSGYFSPLETLSEQTVGRDVKYVALPSHYEKIYLTAEEREYLEENYKLEKTVYGYLPIGYMLDTTNGSYSYRVTLTPERPAIKILKRTYQ